MRWRENPAYVERTTHRGPRTVRWLALWVIVAVAVAAYAFLRAGVVVGVVYAVVVGAFGVWRYVRDR